MNESPGVVDLLGVLAYAELSAFARMTEDAASLAPSLADQAALSELAVAEYAHFRLLHDRLTELGADPARIVARTGPAVCGKCYEVPEEMRADVAAVEPAAHAETSWGTPSVDVTAGVHAQLDRLGVRDRQQSPVCTLESGDHFSYRRDRTTGRLAGYVWLD